MIKDYEDYIEKVNQLNYYTSKYDEGNPEISDKEWDDLYFAIKEYEKTHVPVDFSPSQSISYQVVNSLQKVTHSHPMLSLDKTKDIRAIKSFIKGHDWIVMAKMDGLTCSLRYLDGKLFSAETRGNGVIGENITHNAKVIPSIPKVIDYKDELIVDGEIICTYKDFEEFKETYKNPRNFASGSIRLLDAKECSRRHLTFIAWDVIKGGEYPYLSANLSALTEYGFEIVPMFINNKENDPSLESYIDTIKRKSELLSYPIDGVVFKYDKIEEYTAAGRTDHHFKGGLAYKFYDETYSTKLKYIDWTMGRTGQLTPTAVFNPIDIDGSTVERASLHNVSIMKETLGDCAYVGEPLEVCKMNQIIPQIVSAGPKYSYGEVIAAGGVSANDMIEICPICGSGVEIRQDGIAEICYCTNPNCSGKLINKLDHFCGKKGLDIKGLSKATLEKLIDWNWVSCFKDIYRLQEHKKEWITKEGFGEKSVQNILDSIENSRQNDLWRVIAAAGIPNIGVTAAKQLANYFKTYAKFRSAIEEDFDFTELQDFGEITADTLLNFDYEEIDDVVFYAISCNPVEEKQNKLENITFCITGKLHDFKNRTELKNLIESLGGKATDSVSSKTNYLINNDINSTSSKNKTAKSLGVEIITEKDFLDMIASPFEK